LKDDHWSHGEVEHGELECDQCGSRYPIVDHVPRFVSCDAYVGSFTFQWQRLPRRLYGLRTEGSFSRFNIDREALSGKRILDVGCGYGRFLKFFSERGKDVVGVDMSYSVNEAFSYCGLSENVHIVQANLLRMPFKESMFDLVFSFGVLHHTPDTRKAFMQLPRHVKPGGKLAIFVYAKWFETGLGGWSNKVKERFSDSYRRITSRLPGTLLYGLCHMAIPLYRLTKLPRAGTLIAVAFPIGFDPDWRLRIIDTFDWYSPKYQWKHTRREVEQWFEQSGLTDLFLSPYPVSIVGTRPPDPKQTITLSYAA